MNPEFYSLQMNVTGETDAEEFASYLGRYGRTLTAMYVLGVLMNLAELANEENR